MNEYERNLNLFFRVMSNGRTTYTIPFERTMDGRIHYDPFVSDWMGINVLDLVDSGLLYQVEEEDKMVLRLTDEGKEYKRQLEELCKL